MTPSGGAPSDTFTPEPQAQVEALYEQARAIDRTFARAYTGLAFVHLNRWIEGGMRAISEPDEHRPAALRLAEEALSLDPNDPRVHSTLGFMCLSLREFDRAERHMDLARAMNPNDPWIQISWASVQGSLGRPERALPAAEIAFRLNPRHPGFYEHFLSRLLFQLGRYAEAAALLEQRNFITPVRRAATYRPLGRIADAQHYGHLFLESAATLWRGDPTADAAAFVDRLVDVSLLRRKADMERLRAGLRLAGLPA